MKKKSALDFMLNSGTLQSSSSVGNSFATGTLDMAADAAGLTDEQIKARNIRKESGVSYITLDSGRRIRFQSVYIPADDLPHDTRVHPFNLRTQETLTEKSCEDILPSIKKAGVKMPALATRDPIDKAYLVFDGSRRRYAAIACGQGLQIDYTDEELTDDDIVELSHIANLTKSSSLYDQGKYYQSRLERLNISMNAYSKQEDIPIATISYALKAYRIPRPIFNLFPSKTDLGRSFILKIAAFIEILPDEEVDEIVEFCKTAETSLTDNDALEVLLNYFGREIDNQKSFEVGDLKVKMKNNKITLQVPKNFDFEAFQEFLSVHYNQ